MAADGSARVGARVHSLSSLGLAEAEGLDAISREKVEDAMTDDAPMWVQTFDFLPRTTLDPPRWKKTGYGKWQHHEHISVLES